MAYIGTKPANQVIDSTLIADGTVTPSDLSTGKPVWDTSGNLGIGTTSPATKLHTYTAGVSLQAMFEGTTLSPYIQVKGNSGSTLVGNESTGGWIGTIGSQALVIKTNDTERMRIDSSGRVTTPYQPAFRVRRAADWTKTGAGTAVVPFDTSITNIGNNYNTSTYRFTAPVAGMYHFETTVGTNGSAPSMGYYGVIFTVNNSTVLDGWGRQENTGYAVDSKAISIYLNQNDYVQIVLEAAATITTAGNQNNFSGYLIG